MPSAESPCALMARTHDNDRYLAGIFAPPERREALFALVAFNIELARVPDTISEPMLGHIRYAWWREALAEIYADAKPRHHQVVEALALAIHEYRLPQELFSSMIDARDEVLEKPVLETIPLFETYLSRTSGKLLELWALILGVKERDAIRELGLAWGKLGTLRNMQKDAMAGILRLPQELLKPGTEADILALRFTPAIAQLVQMLLQFGQCWRVGLPAISRHNAAFHALGYMGEYYQRRVALHAYNPFISAYGSGGIGLKTRLLARSMIWAL